ncbi:MAG: heavy metal-binding domain-containing protein [Eubacteriaceae bacterium]|nr:heavy metal-binding domain-containing protein [Eubacteriaceae bacterium]
MKVKEIAQKYDLNAEAFSRYCNHGDHGIKVNFLTSNVSDGDVETLVALYRQFEATEERKAKALETMLVTNGIGFEGYRIVKYCGVVSGDEAQEVKSLVYSSPEQFSATVAELRAAALAKLMEAAFCAGGTALTGVDFDYITLDQSKVSGGETKTDKMMLCVTATGTAVSVEKE